MLSDALQAARVSALFVGEVFVTLLAKQYFPVLVPCDSQRSERESASGVGRGGSPGNSVLENALLLVLNYLSLTGQSQFILGTDPVDLIDVDFVAS